MSNLYERVNWENSPSKKTPINDANLNKMDKGIKDLDDNMPTHDLQENTVTFDSYDDEKQHETLMEVPSIKTGEKLGSILSKITKFTNNIRYIVESLAIEKMQEAGFHYVGDAIKNLSVDYIAEEGTSGIWTYRKWSSGIAECWGLHDTTAASTGNIATAVDYPFEFDSSNGYPIVTLTPGYNSTLYSYVKNCDAGGNRLSPYKKCDLLYMGVNGTTYPFGCNIHVIGRWKE